MQQDLDLLQILHKPKQGISFTFSDDFARFKDSLFIPFVVKDAAKVLSYSLL